MIDDYKFGSIVIDGKTYTYDVEVNFRNDVFPWKRKESHIIDIDSVKMAVRENPDMIIIGTGESGMAKIKNETKEFIERKKIKLVVDITGRAVKIFNNETKEGKKAIGLLHLTC